MAVYTVPQDVEAEDKLIGPLSFRQFIYLMIAGGSTFVAFLLFQVTPLAALIPTPFILVFGVLSLPLRKDQPMEIYLLAILKFVFKSKRRVWNPDGILTHVIITAPKAVEQRLTKEMSQETAQEKLDYLARVMDSRGWSVKGVSAAEHLNPGVANEAADTFDIMDDHADVARNFDQLIEKKKKEHRTAALQSMQKAQAKPATQPRPEKSVLQSQFEQEDQTVPRFAPYPNAIHQKVISPYQDQPTQETEAPIQKPAEKPVPAAVSPDIIRLASNNDLSISAIAHEARRLQEGDEGEVVISLH